MRSFRVSSVASSHALVSLVACAVCVGCAQQVPPEQPATHCPPEPASSASSNAPVNGTHWSLEPLTSPSSKMSASFAAPELGQTIALADAPKYRVSVTVVAAEPDALGIDVALDGERPRRLTIASPSITLAELVRADADLAPGAHWLFAAPVLASGLVPRAAAAAPRAAVARRFFVDHVTSDDAGPSGALWLRKPEGTYNGKSSEHVLFDAFAFSATGAPLDTPFAIALTGGPPGTSGEVRFPAPFSVRDVESGDYELSVSAARARSVSTRFTVNHELGGAP